jgi:hypothetical protein
MWSFGRWLRAATDTGGTAAATGLFGKYLSLLPEKAFEPKLALKTMNVAADEKRLPIF